MAKSVGEEKRPELTSFSHRFLNFHYTYRCLLHVLLKKEETAMVNTPIVTTARTEQDDEESMMLSRRGVAVHTHSKE